MDPRPIGIFDSGIGGLTVTNAMQQALPTERLLYFADTVHIPYGQRSLEEVRQFSTAITRVLIAADCKLIVIACNTASAAALAHLRAHFPTVAFVGMEPAVKPAVEQTLSGVVGVIATTATFQSAVYASVVGRFAKDVEVIHQPCPGLVQQIEAGELETDHTEKMLRGWLEPMLAKNIDALVLGCTHYPFVRPLIERILGPSVRIIDPAPAVAKQVDRILEQRDLNAPAKQVGGLVAYTSGATEQFTALLPLLGLEQMEVRGAVWGDGDEVLELGG
ncbi:MAG: glutamate racemase [Flavobacteriales bacterium]|nr:glutamate racemase [Flavobacteriales bacterium]MBK7240075.1 glutamate racemase [Flavobacteriales bacterium]MBK7297131.1 glutamate racemase [Flavobacteriales bacterium]MBK9535603.1 glutamate racemase [Flavobacteriales bacterium]MBP9138693.1 glutamate racemase [Flavobacteriales bacterium]